MKKLIKILDHPYFSWLVILLIFVLQFLMTQNSLNQVRFEELSESVRNVYFLDQRQIFDGISSNVGWYGTVLLLYKIFGFNLFLVKFYKLIFFLLSLISLDQILKSFLVRFRFLPILIFGLSPTIVFFNVLEAGFGIDLLYLPIIFSLLLIWKSSKKINLQLVLSFLIWFLVMIASMSYGTFLVYLPFLGLYYLYGLYQQKNDLKNKLSHLCLASAGFLFPFLLVLNYLKDPAKLIYDPSNGSGIFRGGGVGEKVTSLEIFVNHLKLSLNTFYQDLFVSGQSYYYEPLRVELSHKIFPLIIFILVICSFYIVFKEKKSRLIIANGYLLIALGISVGGISDWFPGIRRMTPVMMGCFIVIVGMWSVWPKLIIQGWLDKVLALILIFSLGLIVLHHIKVYPDNIAGLKRDSQHKANDCFHLDGKNPNQSIEYYVDQVIAGEVVEVEDECRLHELYPVIAGACKWNNLNCQDIIFNQDKEFKKPMRE